MSFYITLLKMSFYITFRYFRMDDIPGFEAFKTELKILVEIQTLFLDFIENDDDAEIFKYLKQIDIINNNERYVVLLFLISKSPIYRFSKRGLNAKLWFLMEHLINDFDLMKIFDIDFIFNTFKKNKTILLFLFKNGIITSEILKRKMQVDYQTEKHIFILIKDGSISYDELDIDPSTLNNHYFEDDNSNGNIFKIIQNDDIDNFTNALSHTNLNINSYIIPPNKEFSKENKKQKFSLIECSALYGSINIFKYLLSQKAKINAQKIYLCSIEGGNYEIIHLLENNGIDFPKGNANAILSHTVCYHRNELYEYFSSQTNSNYKDNYIAQMKDSILNLNLYHLFLIVSNITFKTLIKSTKLKEICKLLLHCPLICLLKFICAQPKKDINCKSSVSLFLYSFIFYIYILLRRFLSNPLLRKKWFN